MFAVEWLGAEHWIGPGLDTGSATAHMGFVSYMTLDKLPL